MIIVRLFFSWKDFVGTGKERRGKEDWKKIFLRKKITYLRITYYTLFLSLVYTRELIEKEKKKKLKNI